MSGRGEVQDRSCLAMARTRCRRCLRSRHRIDRIFLSPRKTFLEGIRDDLLDGFPRRGFAWCGVRVYCGCVLRGGSRLDGSACTSSDELVSPSLAAPAMDGVVMYPRRRCHLEEVIRAVSCRHLAISPRCATGPWHDRGKIGDPVGLDVRPSGWACDRARVSVVGVQLDRALPFTSRLVSPPVPCHARSLSLVPAAFPPLGAGIDRVVRAGHLHGGEPLQHAREDLHDVGRGNQGYSRLPRSGARSPPSLPLRSLPPVRRASGHRIIAFLAEMARCSRGTLPWEAAGD